MLTLDTHLVISNEKKIIPCIACIKLMLYECYYFKVHMKVLHAFPKAMSRPVLIFYMYMYCQKSFVEIKDSQFIYHLFIHILWVVS